MLQKWKSILTNWINCYFNDSRNEQNLNIESLLNIISHLRENLNLDESKSSKLSAHSVEEFIVEKYPEFKFENGTVEATNEEQVCLAASLLLYFVCVNSKDIDIKSAMCSQLSDGDQEIILKFSKHLMACSPILCRDVQSAIADACSHDGATIPTTTRVQVAETPPALRSLHSEVRRLQAALDAERFDRNYLQDELNRTNLRVEKLLKEKEEYKMDIVDLKMKISMCCGQEDEARGAESNSDKSATLARQLKELEERLVQTQGEIDDAVYERDTYKAKAEELKQDRDKWLTLSQQETVRVSQLSEELEIERRNTQSLRDLVNELRQHNRLNRVDSSFLECDDPDASIQSLPHNTSICSEVCANVVEVQLGEERAKIVVLKQQIQDLQEQIDVLMHKSADEKLTLETIITERETDIFNLKHRINEEIEEKNNLKIYFSDEMSKLNNEINELEQKLKDNNDNSRAMIEQKMQDIQILQEEKLSLLQSLSDETTKLENIIKDLKTTLDTERQSKMNMKESYDSHIMKLNEKMLNRNNELVELQNNIFQNSETIEALHLDLRREKELREDLANKYHNDMLQLTEQAKAIEHRLQEKISESNELKSILEQKSNMIEGLYRELDNLKQSLSNSNERCKILEEDNVKLTNELHTRDVKLKEIYKDIENLKNVFIEERGKLCFDLDERNATINTLKMQLQNEIQYKIELEKELEEMQNAKTELSDKLNKATVEISDLHSVLKEKDKNIHDIESHIKEARHSNKQLKSTTEKLNKQLKKMTDDLKLKNNEVTSLNTQIKELNKSFNNEIKNKENVIEEGNKKLTSAIAAKEGLQAGFNDLSSKNAELEKVVDGKANIILQLQKEKDEFSKIVADDKKAVQILEEKLKTLHQKYIQLEHTFDTETSRMIAKLNDTEKIIKELSTNSKKTLNKKEFQIQTLNMELANIHKVLENNQACVTVMQNEKQALKVKLDEEVAYRNKIEEEYQKQCVLLVSNADKFSEEVSLKNAEMETLKADLQRALQDVQTNSAVVKKLEDKITIDREHMYEKGSEIKELRAKLSDMESLNDELEQELKKETNSKKQMTQALQKENEQLHYTIEEDNSNHEMLLSEKDRVIDSLERRLKITNVQLEALKKDYEDMTLNWEKLKVETYENLESKVGKINELQHELVNLEQKLTEATHLNATKIDQIEKLTQQIEELEGRAQEEKVDKDSLETENRRLLGEVASFVQSNTEITKAIAILTQELAEEKAVREIVEEEKKGVLIEKAAIEKELAKEITAKEMLLEDKECLTQQLVEEISAKELAEREKEILMDEKLLIEKNLNEEKRLADSVEKEKESVTMEKRLLEQKSSGDDSKIFDLNQEIDKLIKKHEVLEEIINTEKTAKDLAENEKNHVVAENLILQQKLNEAGNKITELNKEIYELVDKQKTLEEIIKTEQIAKEHADKEKRNIVAAKQMLEQNITVKESDITSLKQEIHVLLNKQAALEETINTEELDKKLIVREKQNILQEKQGLEQQLSEAENKIMALKQEIDEIVHKHSVLEESIKLENEKLQTELNEQKECKNRILKEKECHIIENISLKQEIIDKEAAIDTLESEKYNLMEEKQTLMLAVGEEKSIADEIQNEKNVLSNKIEEISQQYNSELVSKAKEIENVKTEIEHLTLEYHNQLENNKKVNSNLNAGLERITQNFRKEDIRNEFLQKLLTIDAAQISVAEKCELLVNVADTLLNEVRLRKSLEKALEDENTALIEMQEMCKQKEMEILNLQTEMKRIEQVLIEKKIEMSKQNEVHTTAVNTKTKELQLLQHENETLRNDLNNVKLQLEVKVHSLKEKLTDNEHLTDKLKRSYECQIDNLNMMITKLTAYLKDKTVELESVRKEKETLQHTIEENLKAIKSLETEVQNEKRNQEKLISDFESERLVLKNMVTVTESVMEDQKISLNNIISEHAKINESLQEENKILKDLLENEKSNTELKLHDKDVAIEKALKELAAIQEEKIKLENTLEFDKANLSKEMKGLRDEINLKSTVINKFETDNKTLEESLQKYKDETTFLQDAIEKLKVQHATLQAEMKKIIDYMTTELNKQKDINVQLEADLKERNSLYENIQSEVEKLTEKVLDLEKEKHSLGIERNEWKNNFDELQTKINLNEKHGKEALEALKKENLQSIKEIEDQKIVIINLEQLIKHELEENQMLRDDNANEKLTLVNKFSLLQDWQTKAEKDIEEKQKEIVHLQDEVAALRTKIENYEQDLKAKDEVISQIGKDKDAIISTISRELLDEKTLKEKWQKECENKIAALYDIQAIEAALRNENEELVKAVGERETFAVQNEEKLNAYQVQVEKDRHQQVDNSSDLTHSSMESFKTITDLEKIIHDKNRTITTLQSDITYLKTLMAESETKLMDVTNDLEVSKENCQQLSSQLKKIVYQKNEEIAELKKQVNKMSVTENRATQIIKVSAKYQAIILKRIAEIKSNTVLKELTNFGNSNSDNELRRGLNVGTITMEDLENFLETTDKHLKRCSEKQNTLQKDRDRLAEINRINESEIINLKKFLTELSVSFQTFNSMRDLYSQKLSRIVSIQRTVRREILNLDGHLTDACMCKLERGYAAVMQDLAECSMNLERWVERCVSRAISPEKIKQAFMGDYERASLASTSFQNAGLEVQLEELDGSFQKLLEEVARAAKGEGVKDAAAVTVQEVRAEYEDKLNRMKAKMKQLYQEQIGVFKEKQREEVAMLERELQKAREKLAESSRAYEEHIRSLTTELWSVGEKFLMKKDEAEWLRRKQRSGSLMSLQHVHSSGLMPTQEEPSRPSDSHSLRSLPVNNNNTKREGRGLHMSDEEGEVFDNRFLKELSTPRRDSGVRLSELRWRNSLCPPHLKSSYPAETQFAPALDEEDIKFAGVPPGRPQRKEVGITAYKKPGPPTPSKQAGRLSATDSELRESLRVEADPLPSRKTSTPSRIRALFRSAKNETNEGTPRTRRLSNIFRKK